MHEDGETRLGTATRGFELAAEITLKTLDRRRHLYVVGKTGTGKSTFLRGLMLDDFANGRPFAFIDPLGPNAEILIDNVPPEFVNDIRYLELADTSYPRGLNPLHNIRPAQRALVASQILSAFQGLFGGSLADWPRLSYILQNSVLLLLHSPGETLLGLSRLLVDERYRRRLLKNCSDPVVRAYFETEFADYERSFMTIAIAPVQNKIGLVLTESIRLMLGQRRSTIDVRAIVRDSKYLIVNLSKGRVGPTTAYLAGAFILSQLSQAAEERAALPAHQREQLRDFTVYADEVQDYVTSSFGETLSQARNGFINFCIAHQYLDQLPDGLLPAILGNVGNIIGFRIGASDAAKLAPEMGFESVNAFTDLANYTARALLLRDGEPLEPMLLSIPEPQPEHHGQLASVIARSRSTYSRPRQIVENMIEEQMGRADERPDDRGRR